MANRKRTDYIVIHVTATAPGWDKGRAGIDAMHKAMGWSGIGYNGLINPNGKFEVGRGEDAVGAHVAGFNSIAYGISLVGGSLRGAGGRRVQYWPVTGRALQRAVADAHAVPPAAPRRPAPVVDAGALELF